MGNQEGLNNDKGNLFWEIIRILNLCKPKSFLLENVPGLLKNKYGETLQIIMFELQACGYYIKYEVIDAVGWVPQVRKRLYFVGFLDFDAFQNFKFPEAGIPTKTVKSILDISEYIPDKTLNDMQWEKIRTSPYFIENPEGRLLNIDGFARTLRSRYKRGYTMCSQFVPQNGNNPRFLTERETARLQGFPDNYILPEKSGIFYKFIGNAVCPMVIQEIVKKILIALNIS